jgi:hypothetical protein
LTAFADGFAPLACAAPSAQCEKSPDAAEDFAMPAREF